MKKVLNFGSLNVDFVYRVDHFVRPGETISCQDFRRFAGGKGLNQSIALAHAGVKVYNAGKIGKADDWLKTMLQHHGVDTTFVASVDGPSGHAIIQVNNRGENAIVIFGGANAQINHSDVEQFVTSFSVGDYLLLQNEVNAVPEILSAAKQHGLTIVFNPAPMTAKVASYPLNEVNILIVNEVEAFDLTGESHPEKINSALRNRFPETIAVLTLGAQGAMYGDKKMTVFQPAETVEAVDTTAAGDTFIGFFLAELINSADPRKALQIGCQAAALCVTRQGAADSIPRREELEMRA